PPDDDLETRVYDPRSPLPGLDGESGRVALPIEPEITEPVGAGLSLNTGIGPFYRMPLHQSARRRKVLVAVTLVSLAAAAGVLFVYLKSIDTARPAALEVVTTPGATVRICQGDSCQPLGT